MVFRCTERRTSRASSRDSYALEFNAAGVSDDAYVRANALAASPALVNTPDAGTLFRQDVQLDWQGRDVCYVKVPYGPRKKESGNFRLSFDTTGGTIHIKLAKSHVASKRLNLLASELIVAGANT